MSQFKTLIQLSKMISKRKITVFESVARPVSMSSTHEKKQPEEVEEDLNTPIKFSTSPAAKWRAKTSRSGEKEPRLWFEPYVILGSLAVFMFYFFILREESDIDEEFGRTLYSRIEGLEEQQLRLSLEYNKERGLSSGQIENRLQEIQKEETLKK